VALAGKAEETRSWPSRSKDGVTFDASSIDVGPIHADREYGGVRVRVEARITTAVVRLQADIGFGDVITPEAAEIEFPSLLDFPAPRLRAYPRERRWSPRTSRPW